MNDQNSDKMDTNEAVTLIIDYPDGTQNHFTIPYVRSPIFDEVSVLDVLRAVQGQCNGPVFVLQDEFVDRTGRMRAVITSVNGIAADSNTEPWQISINEDRFRKDLSRETDLWGSRGHGYPVVNPGDTILLSLNGSKLANTKPEGGK